MEKNILLGVIILCIVYFILNKNEHYENNIRSKYTSNVKKEEVLVKKAPISNNLVKGIFDKILEKYNEFFTIECNFLYKVSLPTPSSSVVVYPLSNILLQKTTTPSAPTPRGFLSLTQIDKTKSYFLKFSVDDLNGNNGLIEILKNGNNLVIDNSVTLYSLPTSNYEIDSSNTYINIIVNLAQIPDVNSYFSINTTFTLFPCNYNIEKSPSVDNSQSDLNALNQIIINENIYKTFLIFVAFIVIVMLIINIGPIYNYLSNIKSPLKSPSISTGGNYYYLGGYDYRDYSE